MTLPISPLVYLRNQLGFQLPEWQKLDDATKTWYRAAAVEELKALGLPVAESK